MEYFGIVIGLIGVMFLSIIGVYVWTYTVSRDTNNNLAEIYKIVNGHLQKANIHGEVGKFISSEVCSVLHSELKEDVMEIKTDVKRLLVSAGA